jgi:hypothetical protein
MSELTKPVSVLTYANTAGILATTIYTNNKLNATNTKLKDVAEDVDMIRDGIKEKVPTIENNIKQLDNVIKNIVQVFNNQAMATKKTEKKHKKLYRVIEELLIRLDESESRYARLLNELKTKNVLEASVVDSMASSIAPIVAPPPPPKPAPKPILSRRLSSDSSDSDSSESEDERQKSKKKSKKSKAKSDSEEDEIEKVVRLARSKH